MTDESESHCDQSALSAWEWVALILMVAAAGLGFWYGGEELGLWIALAEAVAVIGWCMTWRRRGRRRCATCHRPVINLGSPRSVGPLDGRSFNLETLEDTEADGVQCLACRRIYCSNCTDLDPLCRCGRRCFRPVRLQYKP